jgi:hypothetical protein
MKEGNSATQASPRAEAEARTRLTEAAHIFALVGFAVAQPLFDRLARNLVFLKDQGIRPVSLVTLTFFLCVLVPGLILLFEMAVGFVRTRARERLHATIVCLLVALIALPLFARLRTLPSVAVVGASLAAGAITAIGYERYALVRMFFTAASPAAVVFPTMFLFVSPVAGLVRPAQSAEIHASIGNPVPVVIVLFDEFGGTSLMNVDREIDRARYPNFAALAEDATWYRNATAVHWRTLSAVPALLTGNYPREGRQGVAADYPGNLFAELSAAGYEPVVFEPVTRLYPEDAAGDESAPVARQVMALGRDLARVYVHHVTPHDLRVLLPRLPGRWIGQKETEADIRARRTGVMRYAWNTNRDVQRDHFVECISPSDPPRLYFWHVVLPHYPWCYLPSGRKYLQDLGSELEPLGSQGPASEDWAGDEFACIQGQQRYLLQVGYADRMLGRVLDRLQSTDLYDRSLIIVTADHGIAFQPNRSRREPTAETLHEIMTIPLLVKLPGQRAGRISDRNVETIDLMPTIADVLDLDWSGKPDGSSLCDESQPERPEKILFTEKQRFKTDGAFEEKWEVLGRMLSHFGSGDRDALFGIGPHPELIGRQISDLPTREPNGVEIEMSQTNFKLSDDPDDLVPCFIKGRVAANPPGRFPVELAIAVNGIIRAVTRTYELQDLRNVWSAMIPESSLEAGDNHVEVFVISSDSEKLMLEPVRIR